MVPTVHNSTDPQVKITSASPILLTSPCSFSC